MALESVQPVRVGIVDALALEPLHLAACVEQVVGVVHAVTAL